MQSKGITLFGKSSCPIQQVTLYVPYNKQSLIASINSILYYYNNYLILSKNEFEKTYERFNNDLNKVTNPSVLYFAKETKFPRMLIQNSGLKRCIKQDKADCIVINDPYKDFREFIDFALIQNTKTLEYYMADNKDAIRMVNKYSPQNKNRILDVVVEKLAEATKYPKECFKIITHSEDYKSINISGNPGLANYYLGEYDKPLITVSWLNRFLSKDCSSLTIDEYNTIKGMLQSEDLNVREIGLKSISGYDMVKYKNSILLLLRLCSNYIIGEQSIKNNVLAKNILNQFNIRKVFSQQIIPVLQIGDYENFSQEDNDLFKAIVNKELDEYANHINQQLVRCNENRFDFKIEYKLENISE